MTDKPMTAERLCICCHYPIHPAETELRRYPDGAAHSEGRCIWVLKEEIRALKAERDFLKTSWDEYERRATKIIQERGETIEDYEAAMREVDNYLSEHGSYTSDSTPRGLLQARLEKP